MTFGLFSKYHLVYVIQSEQNGVLGSVIIIFDVALDNGTFFSQLSIHCSI